MEEFVETWDKIVKKNIYIYVCYLVGIIFDKRENMIKKNMNLILKEKN